MKYTRLFEDFIKESGIPDIVAKMQDNSQKANDIKAKNTEIKQKIKDNFQKEAPLADNKILAYQTEINTMKLRIIDLQNKILRIKIEKEQQG
jgi:hypothetical protein